MSDPEAITLSDSPAKKTTMKQMRLPFAPIQKDSAINVQRQRQLEEAKKEELLKAEKEAKEAVEKAKEDAEKEAKEAVEKAKEVEKTKEAKELVNVNKAKNLDKATKAEEANNKTEENDGDKKGNLKKKVPKKRKLSDSADTERVESRRKSLKSDKSSEPLRVTEANIAQEEITHLKVKIKPKKKAETPKNKDVRNSSVIKTPSIERAIKSVESATCSPSALEDRKRSFKVEIAKLKVNVNESMAKMETAVKDQEFLVAAELKSTITAVNEEIGRLEKILEAADPVELKRVLFERKTAATPVGSRKRPVAVVATPGTPSLSDGSPNLKAKKLTPKQMIIQQQKEERLKVKEEEKRQKAEQRLKEKQEKDELKEKERLEKEALKEKERLEKERQKKEKEEEKERERVEKLAEKERQKKEKEEEKQRKEEEKERERIEKLAEKERHEQMEKAKQEKLKNSFKSFFVKSSGAEPAVTKTEETASEVGNFNEFRIKKNMRLAPLIRRDLAENCRRQLEACLETSEASVESLYIKAIKSGKHEPLSSGKTWRIEPAVQDDDEDDIKILEEEEILQSETGIEIDIADCDVEGKKKITACSRAKLLQFCENDRPAYWGTWTKKSARVGSRRPFAKDCEFFDYGYDSDEDWEEEEEGESLSDEEQDKEEDDKDEDIEDDNEDGFFVGHGVLDKDEANLDDSDADDESEFDEEIKRMKMKAAQFEEDYKNKKKRIPSKLKPRVYGCFWVRCGGDEIIDDDDVRVVDKGKDAIVYEQLRKLLGSYHAISHESGCIGTSFSISRSSPNAEDQADLQADSAEKVAEPKPLKKLKEFPVDAIPDLIKLVHKNQRSKKILAKEFLAFWNENSAAEKGDMSKTVILDRLTEIAAYTKTRWEVKANVLADHGGEPKEQWEFKTLPTPKTPSSDRKSSEKTQPSPSPSTPKSLITKFAKVMTPEERLKQMQASEPKQQPLASECTTPKSEPKTGLMAKHLVKKRITPITVDLTDDEKKE